MNYVPFYVRLEHRSKSMTRNVSKPSQNISKDTVETVYIIQWCILRSVHWATNCTNMYIPAKSYKERVFRLFRQTINVNVHKKTSLCHQISLTFSSISAIRMRLIRGRVDKNLEWSCGKERVRIIRNGPFAGNFDPGSMILEVHGLNPLSYMLHTVCIIQTIMISKLQHRFRVH